jgi:CRP/FNR family transcriptional regulator, cyclic AMP receptor protein
VVTEPVILATMPLSDDEKAAVLARLPLFAGRVRVIRGSDELAVLGSGDFFGELAVIDQRPRGASVEAVEPTRCLALASWDLLDLLEHDPKLSLNLIRGLVARIRDQGEHPHH